MSNIRPFQIVLLAGFAFLAVVALIFLSAFRSERAQEQFAYGERVLIWGTLSQETFKNVFTDVSRDNDAFNVVEYRQIPKDSFDTDLVNAIAEGRSPDMIILPSGSIVQHRTKLLPIPYTTLTEREYRDRFVDGAEVYLFDEGTYGIPFLVDPLVMYWNRDIFSSGGIAVPPTNWEILVTDVVPALTRRDSSRNILQSTVAFGEYRNVENAKELMTLLTLQSGSRMVEVEGTRYRVNLNEPITVGARDPLESALQFYTDFSNINSPLYSWNRGMNNDKTAFIGGDLALYFGFGSELSDIANKNPNLNFDMAPVPQGVTATALRTYGDFYAFAIPRASGNVQGAYAVASILSSSANSQKFATDLGMASPRRDVLAVKETDLYRNIIASSALIARSWLDPQPQQSDSILMQMVEDVVSNRARISEAVDDAVDRLLLVF